MVRKFFASFLFFIFFALSGPILFIGSLLLPYANFEFVMEKVIPRSYEIVLNPLISTFTENLKIEQEGEKTKIENWIKGEFTKEKYVSLVSQAFLEIRRGVANLPNDASGRVEIGLKDTKKLFIREALSAFKKFPQCPEGGLRIKSEGFPTCFPQNLPSEQRRSAIEAIREDLETNLPPRIVFDSGNPFFAKVLSARIYFSRIPFFLTGLFIFPLFLMGFLIGRPIAYVARWEASALLLTAFQGFGLFFIFQEMPRILGKFQELSEVQKAGIQFFFFHPSRILFIMSIVLFAISLFLFFIFYRYRYQKKASPQEHHLPLVIRSGKLRKGSHANS